MPAFVAINVEPEENIDEEIDTSRSIHVEDALKRFQTALKLHAQGPRRYEEASAAYDSLFESEIFRYPDSATEFERAEQQTDPRNLPLDLSFTQALDASHADAEGSASSLPQALYMAYKNHGQFELDGIKHKARSAENAGEVSEIFNEQDTLKKAHNALYDFSAALDHDPSDAELWRRAARVAAFLQSARINRYCLEAAIELDDDPAVEEVEPPSLAEGFAGEQLKTQLEVLSDDIALTHPIMDPYTKRIMPNQLKKYIDPIPFLPNPTNSVAVPRRETAGENDNLRAVLQASGTSWAGLGMSMVHLVNSQGISGCPLSIELPDTSETPGSIEPESTEQTLIERPKPSNSEPSEETEAVDNPEEPAEEAPQEAQPESSLTDQIEATAAPEDPKTERNDSVSRKRSQSTAGFDGDNEEFEKRSKRTRRRETAIDDSINTQTPFAAQLEPYQAADKNLFQITRNMVENLGITDDDTLGRLAELVELSAVENRTAKVTGLAARDLRDSLMIFDEDIAKILLTKKDAPLSNFASFLEHSQTGSQHKSETPMFDDTKALKSFIQKMNSGCLGLADVAFEWVQTISKSYLDFKWPDTLKIAVVQVISHFDEDIFHRTHYDLRKTQSLEATEQTHHDIGRMVQMLFELHLDVYDRITNPNSAVDFSVRIETKGRLARWFSLAAHLSRDRPADSDNTLSVRLLWAVVFYVTFTEGASRDHVLQCWQSLKDTLAADYDGINLRLPNNAVMPEISTRAAERQISKLTTMDFFLGLFQDDLSDPVRIIESLEPVLNPGSVYTAKNVSQTPRLSSPASRVSSKSASPEIEDTQPITEAASQGLRDLWKFLQGASTELRLFLWSRLGEAYQTIQYSTKQFSCNLKILEMVVDDFGREPYTIMPLDERRALFVNMLKFVDDILIQSLSIALNDINAFDIIDDDHLKSSICTLTKLCCILHTSLMYEDEVRVKMNSAPTNNVTFSAYINKLREMQVRNWSLLYTLLKNYVVQNRDVFTTPETDLADYLAAVHQVLGLRKCCKASNKIFLKMMRVELLKQHLIDNWEDYLGQVLFDLYGLKGIGAWEVQDHACPAEKLERRNTAALVDKISVLARRMPMKDLLKSDLKTTIEHMQQAIGQTKSNQQTIHNLRNFTEYLKKPIHPLRLYQAMSGSVTIDAVAVNTPDSLLARHGWFFLLGMIAFSKFKGVDLNRRQTPGATDDLRIGATFLRQQLQFTPDQWDAWFRLAECFDYELDESVLWTADKMNKERAELVKYQRSAIHCYTLALSHSWKALPAADSEASNAIHELYHKFGIRMYASSREPFAMEPFQHASEERFFIENMGAGTFKKTIHEQMEDYKVWKFAAGLFRRAMKVKPKEWKNSYMLAKCIWKMYQKPAESLHPKDREKKPTLEDVINTLEKSVQVVAALPKPRHGQDGILEPYYKIVSVVHKLATRGELQPQVAADILQRQPYAVRNGVEVEVGNEKDLEKLVITTLEKLLTKDKSNWQHRIIMRHARLILNVTPPDANPDQIQQVQAQAVFAVLQKSMFTKTMVMNVWKCDAERPGRHHVYTEQYVRFMVQLLVVLKDRTNFELLLRRLRKKGGDFYHFNDLWQTCIQAYLNLIREHYHVEPVVEDVFKNVSPEEFAIISGRINDWSVSSEEGPEKHPAFNALKEAIELKKLNSGLLKAGPIDEVINDAYTMVYLEVGNSLPGPSPQTIIEDRKRAEERAIVENDGAADTKSNPFGNILNPLSVDNSGAEGAGPAQTKETEATVTKTRRLTVRKPDILRKAEQAVIRALEGPAKPAREKSISGKARNSNTPNGEDKADAADRADAGDLEMKGEDDEGGSAPGSVHDGLDRDDRFDADDESDLSDVPDEDLLDEEEAQRLMFPGLRRRSSEGDDEEREEDEDVEGEVEEIEEGHEEVVEDENGDEGMGDTGEAVEYDEDGELEGDENHGHSDEAELEDDEEGGDSEMEGDTIEALGGTIARIDGTRPE